MTMILVSHPLCPYVQRAAIVAAEKGVALERVSIDLANKPDWFRAISPTSKVPLLRVGDDVLFESAAISEYLDEVSPGDFLPTDPLQRARQRAWVEFASGTLADIAGLYNAADATAFDTRVAALHGRFAQVAQALAGPWFAGDRFGYVDAAFGPVFRYLDAFEALAAVHLAAGLPAIAPWRAALSARQSVAAAVASDYPNRLKSFLLARPSHLSALIRGQG